MTMLSVRQRRQLFFALRGVSVPSGYELFFFILTYPFPSLAAPVHPFCFGAR